MLIYRTVPLGPVNKNIQLPGYRRVVGSVASPVGNRSWCFNRRCMCLLSCLSVWYILLTAYCVQLLRPIHDTHTHAPPSPWTIGLRRGFLSVGSSSWFSFRVCTQEEVLLKKTVQVKLKAEMSLVFVYSCWLALLQLAGISGGYLLCRWTTAMLVICVLWYAYVIWLWRQ